MRVVTVNSRTRIYPFTLGQAAPTRGLFFARITSAAPTSSTVQGGGKRLLFDYLVGAREQHWRYLEPERFRSLEVDGQFNVGRKLDW